jgi:pyruvate,water dikinase
LVDTLKAYLEGKGSDPYARQRAAAEKRDQATEAVLRRLDPLRRKWFLKMLRWAQEAAPRREDCISDLGLGYPLLRKVFAKLGRRFVTGEAIVAVDDIYWLEVSEIEALVASLEKGEPLPSRATQVEKRKVQWQRQRRAVVPHLLPEDSFLARMTKRERKGNGQLKGFGASGGRITAQACVLRGPSDFGQMHPGDVIVAVTTTPAWTPLFAIASAIVTEIGGPLSHSSIVAREYGIPAVLAVKDATQHIRSGQTITVDGNAGNVTCQPFERNLPCEPASPA